MLGNPLPHPPPVPRVWAWHTPPLPLAYPGGTPHVSVCCPYTVSEVQSAEAVCMLDQRMEQHSRTDYLVEGEAG